MTKTLTFTENQKAEARRWMLANPWKELTDCHGGKRRRNPDKCIYESRSLEGRTWLATGAVYDYPYTYTYTEPQPEPKTLMLETWYPFDKVFLIHPLLKRVQCLEASCVDSYYVLKAHVDAGHKLYASKEDAELALKLGWS